MCPGRGHRVAFEGTRWEWRLLGVRSSVGVFSSESVSIGS